MGVALVNTPYNTHSTSYSNATSSWNGRTTVSGNLLIAIITGGSVTAGQLTFAQHSGTSGWVKYYEFGNGTGGSTYKNVISVWATIAGGSDAAPAFDGSNFSGGTYGVDISLFEFSGAPATAPFFDTAGFYQSGTSTGTLTNETATTQAQVYAGTEYAVSVFSLYNAATGHTWTDSVGTFSVASQPTASSVLATYVGTLSAPSAGATVNDAGAFSGNTAAFGSGLIFTIIDASNAPRMTTVGGSINTHVATSSGTSAWGPVQNRTANNLLAAVVTGTSAAPTATISFAQTAGTSGWTQQFTVTDATGTNSKVVTELWTITASGGDAAPAFTLQNAGGTSACDITLFEIHGASISTPIDKYGTYVGGSSRTSGQTFTASTAGNPSAAGEFVLSCFAQELTAVNTTFSDSGGFSTVIAGNAVSSELSTYVGLRTNASTGSVATDSGTFVSSTSAFGAGFVAALSTSSISETISASAIAPAVTLPAISLVIGSEGIAPASVHGVTTISGNIAWTGMVVTPAVVTPAVTFPALTTIVCGQTVPPVALAVSTTIPPPTVNISYTTTASAVPGTTTLPAPAISVGSVLTASAVAPATTFPAWSLVIGQTLSPAAIHAQASVSVNTEAVGSVLTPAAIAPHTTFPAPTVVIGSEGIAPGAVAAATTLPASTIVIGAEGIAPSAIHAQATVPAPTVSGPILPAVVQHVSGKGIFTTGSSGTVTATFGSSITPGNTLVAFIGLQGGAYTGTPTVTSVKTNTSVDGWASLGIGIANYQDAWLTSASAGGQTVINVVIAFGSTATTSTSPCFFVDVFEVSNAGALDTSASSGFSGGTNTAWTSGTSPSTTVANEIVLAVAEFDDYTANQAITTITGPSSPWTNYTVQSSSFQNGGTGTGNKYNCYQLVGQKVVSSTGTQIYNGTCTSSANEGFVLVLTLMSSSTSASVTATAVAPATTFPALTNNIGAEGIAPAAVHGVPTFPAYSMVIGQTVSPTAIAAQITLPAPTVITQPVLAVAIHGVTTLPALTTIVCGQNVSPAALAVSTTIPPPTVVIGSEGIAPGAVAAAVTFPSRSMVIGQNVSPAVLHATTTALAVTLTAMTSYNSIVMADTPVGFWEHDGTDLTTNGNTAVLTGTPTNTTLPNGELAMTFDGATQYATIPTQNYFSPAPPVNGGATGILCVEAWLAPSILDFPNETGDYVEWAGKGLNSGTGGDQEWTGRMYGYTDPDDSPSRPNRISGYAFNNTGSLGVGAYFQDTVTVNAWIHYFLVINTQDTQGGTYPYGYVTIYKNGVARNTQDLNKLASPIIPTYNTQPVKVGTKDGLSFFEGAIGKFALYDYMLTPTQIVNHYNAMYQGEPATPGAVAAAVTFPALTVDYGEASTATAVAAAVTLPAPTINLGYTVVASSVAPAVTFPVRTVIQGAEGIAPAAVHGTSTFPASSPFVGAEGVAPTAVHGTTTFPVPAITTGTGVSPGAIHGITTFPAVTPSALNPAVLIVGTPTNTNTQSYIGTSAWGAGQTRNPGDLLVACVAAFEPAGGAMTVTQTAGTTGWTQVHVSDNDAGADDYVQVSMWTKTALGSDAAPSFTCSQSISTMDITLYELNSVSGTPVDTYATYASGGAGTITPTMTTGGIVSAIGELAIAAWGIGSASGGTVTWTDSNGWTVDVATDGTGSTNFGAAFTHKSSVTSSVALTAAGGFGATPDTNAVSAGVMLVFNTQVKSQNITPAAIPADATMPAPVASGGTTATPAAIAAAVVAVPTPTLVIGQTVSPAAIAAQAVVAVGTESIGSILSPATIHAQATLPAPAASGNFTFVASAIAAATTLPAPTLQLSLTLVPAAISPATTLPAPTVNISYTPTATAIHASTAVPPPVIPVFPNSINGQVTFPTSSMVIGQNISPAAIAAQAAVAVGTASVGMVFSATAVPADTTLPAPSLVIGQNYTATACHAQVTFPSPTIVCGAEGIAPAACHGQVTFPASSMIIGQTVSAVAVPADATLPAVGIGTGLTSVAVPADATLPAPSMVIGQTLTQTAVAAATTLPAPSLHLSSIVTPSAIDADATLPAPVLTVGESATLTAAGTIPNVQVIQWGWATLTGAGVLPDVVSPPTGVATLTGAGVFPDVQGVLAGVADLTGAGVFPYVTNYSILANGVATLTGTGALSSNYILYLTVQGAATLAGAGSLDSGGYTIIPAVSWSFVDVASDTGNNNSTLTCLVPSAARNGDLLVLAVWFRLAVAGYISPPTGFSAAIISTQCTNGTPIGLMVCTRVASSEPSSYMVNQSNISGLSIMYAVRGENTTTPVVTSASSAASGTTLTTTALTYTASDLAIYGWGGYNTTSDPALTFPSPSDLLAGSKYQDNNLTQNLVGGMLSCMDGAPGNATSSVSITQGVNFVVELAPAGGAAGNTVIGLATHPGMVGAGSTSIQVTQQTTVPALAGGGTVTNPVAHQGSWNTLAGAGTVANSTITQGMSLTIPGTGSITSKLGVSAGATITGLGAVTGIGALLGQATITGTSGLGSLFTEGGLSVGIPGSAVPGAIVPGFFTPGYPYLSVTEFGGVKSVIGSNSQLSGLGSFASNSNQIGTIVGVAHLTGLGIITTIEWCFGTATLVGAGSTSSIVSQSLSVDLVAGGSLSSLVTQAPVATLFGLGVAWGAKISPATATLTSTSSLGPVQVTHRVAPTLHGQGILRGAQVFMGASGLTGTGHLTNNRILQGVAVTPLVAGGTIVSPHVHQGMTLTISGTGVLGAKVTQRSKATLVGSGMIKAWGVITAIAVLSGHGHLAATGAIMGYMTMLAHGTVTSTVTQHGRAALSIASSLTNSHVIQGTRPTLVGAGTVNSAVLMKIKASLIGAGVFSTPVVMKGHTTLAASTHMNTPLAIQGTTLSIHGVGTISSPIVRQLTSASLAGQGNISAGVVQRTFAHLVASGHLTTAGLLIWVGQALLAGHGTLTSSALSAPGHHGTAELIGHGGVAASEFAPATAVLQGHGTVENVIGDLQTWASILLAWNVLATVMTDPIAIEWNVGKGIQTSPVVLSEQSRISTYDKKITMTEIPRIDMQGGR